MSISANASLEFEAGRTLYPMAALADTGDHQTFEGAAAPWSNADGYAPEVFPNGIETGGSVTPAASGDDDKIDVDALSCTLAGVQTAVAQTIDVTVTRATNTDTHLITSLTVTSLGAIAAVAGSGGTSFSETRGANGGPPFIPVGSIEVAQVRLTSRTAAPVSKDEIFANWGQHSERTGFPTFEVTTMDGRVTFAAALPLIHTGGVPKKVYAKVYTPIFQRVSRALDFAPVESSFSQTSQEFYGGAVGGASESLTQGKFTALLDDGHTDALLGQAGNTLTFRFKQDRNRAPYSLTQGRLGITRTYPKTAQVQAACTITAQVKTQDYAR